MLKKITLLFILLISFSGISQENIDDLLAAGINDAKRFSTDYLRPATEAVSHGINSGWFNHGETMHKFGFSLSVIANVGFIPEDKKAFELNVADYENVRFPDDSPSKMVATTLGFNDPDQTIIVRYDDPIFGDQEVELTLPNGIGAANIELVPTAYIQAGFSPFKGTELKARFFPKIDREDAKVGYYGLGIQQEFTSWLPAEKIWPIAISGLLAYTHLDASYDFTDSSTVDGDNQRVETDINSILGQVVVSTKLKVINFYAGLGYMSATANSDLLGTYRVSDGFIFSEEIVDPFSIEEKHTGLRTTFGTRLKLGFFSLNADYTLAEFNSGTIGLNFSF